MNSHQDQEEAASLLFADSNDVHIGRSRAVYLNFIIPSLVGMLFFLTKVVVGDTFNNGMGVLADMLNEATSDYLPGFAAALIAHGLVV